MRSYPIPLSIFLMAAADAHKGGARGSGLKEEKPAPGRGAPVSNGNATPAAAAAPADAPSVLTEAPDLGDAEFLRKISPKTVIGSRPPIPDVGEERALYRVFGQSHATKTGTTDNGPYCAFLGAFEAIRYSDGKRFQAGQCFVPKAVEDMLVASLLAGQKGDDRASVEFAIEVGVRGVDRPIPYEYTVKNLVKTANADPLAGLRARLLAVPMPPKAIAAPAVTAAAIAAPATTAG